MACADTLISRLDAKCVKPDPIGPAHRSVPPRHTSAVLFLDNNDTQSRYGILQIPFLSPLFAYKTPLTRSRFDRFVNCIIPVFGRHVRFFSVSTIRE